MAGAGQAVTPCQEWVETGEEVTGWTEVRSPPPPPSPTFVDVAKDVQPRLDAPLHCVEQLHAAHPLHLLGDPVQEACVRRRREGGDGQGTGGQAPCPADPRLQLRGLQVTGSPTPGPRRTRPQTPAAVLPRLQGGKAWREPRPLRGRAGKGPEWARHSGWHMSSPTGSRRPLGVHPSIAGTGKPRPERDGGGPRAPQCWQRGCTRSKISMSETS